MPLTVRSGRKGATGKVSLTGAIWPGGAHNSLRPISRVQTLRASGRLLGVGARKREAAAWAQISSQTASRCGR